MPVEGVQRIVFANTDHQLLNEIAAAVHNRSDCGVSILAQFACSALSAKFVNPTIDDGAKSISEAGLENQWRYFLHMASI